MVDKVVDTTTGAVADIADCARNTMTAS